VIFERNTEYEIRKCKKIIGSSIIISIIHIILATYVYSNTYISMDDELTIFHKVPEIFIVFTILVTYSSMIFCIWKLAIDINSLLKNYYSMKLLINLFLLVPSPLFPFIFIISAISWDTDGTYRYIASYFSIIAALLLTRMSLNEIKRLKTDES
jgi:hypothetical protein